MWTITGRSVDPQKFAPFHPEEILYEFDGPRIFTVCDHEGELYLACWSDEDEHATRFVVAPTLPRTIEQLRAGDIAVYEALDQPRCWVCDVSHAGELLKCHRINFADLPADARPAQGTMLWPDSRTRQGSDEL